MRSFLRCIDVDQELADLHSIAFRELTADLCFQPQQPVCGKVDEDSADKHHADHHQPK
jgi:hypothetical protein